MIRLLHTADLHLDAPFPSLGEREEQRRNDLLNTFDRLLNLAIKREVHLFLIAGDLFDSPKPSDACVARVQNGLQRLVDRGIVPVILPGTHDNVVASQSVYRQHSFPGTILLDKPWVDEPVEVMVGDERVYLYGFAFRTFASKDAMESMQRRSPEGVHIGLLHGSRQGSPEWNYRAKDLPFSLPQLRDWGLDYVALGHYHNYETFVDGDTAFAGYPGTPEGKRFGEEGPRQAILATLEEGRCGVEPLVCNSRVLDSRSIDLSGCLDEAQAIAAVRRLGNPDLLLRLELIGIVEAPLDLDRLHSRCDPDFFALELIDKTQLFASDFAKRIEDEETVRGLFVRRARVLLQDVPDAEKSTVEAAFREVMVRFHAFSGDES
ncbi:MAG: DNA repair exonuclease [Desulfuromonas sp.]|nr:MAG: DNA repair exonuclease [Desulfuromonas sp.]